MHDFISPDPVGLHARLRPETTAAIDLATERHWSYRALDIDIQRAVRVLTDRGVTRGERVAALARNCVHQVILQQALMRIGAIFVPMNWRLSLPELTRLLQDCTPNLIVADQGLPDLPEGCAPLTMQDFVAAVDAAEIAPRCPPHSGLDCCIILYTSGTSGTPKGAMLTSRFLLATAVNFNVLGEVDTGAVFLCDSPMFHVIGAVTQIWPPFLRGGKIVVSSGFDAEQTNDRLGDPQLGITHYFCVPQMADAMRHASNFDPARWTSLKALFTGGAPNPPANIRWWLDQGVRMVDGYGMTETGTTLGMPLSPELLRQKAGAVGLCGPLTNVRIVDEDGRDVPDGATGEILVFGLNVIPGYWNRPRETDDSFTPDGWIRTGDIGCRDADGFISVVDRRKDMYISGGENVYPVEVEAVLREHSSVRDVAVIGIPDNHWGEVGRAYVIAAPDHQPDAADLNVHCQSRLARYKIPKEFIFVTDLPRTGSGKVMKHILRKETVDG